MKLDITKLPVVEGVVGFLILVIIVMFVGAFSATGDGEGEAVSESPEPTPGENGSPGGSPSPGGPIAVILDDDFFDPDTIRVEAGSTATFELTNAGGATHNMHIAGPDGEYSEDFCTGTGDPCSDPARMPPDSAGTLVWQVPDDPGEVDFRCDFHPATMTGTITIE